MWTTIRLDLTIRKCGSDTCVKRFIAKAGRLIYPRRVTSTYCPSIDSFATPSNNIHPLLRRSSTLKSPTSKKEINDQKGVDGTESLRKMESSVVVYCSNHRWHILIV